MRASVLCSMCCTFGLVFAFCGTLMAAPSVAFEGAAPTTYKVGKATVYTIQDVARAMPTRIFSGADAEKIRSLAPDGTAPRFRTRKTGYDGGWTGVPRSELAKSGNDGVALPPFPDFASCLPG